MGPLPTHPLICPLRNISLSLLKSLTFFRFLYPFLLKRYPYPDLLDPPLLTALTNRG
ncbi:hypothetical protein Hanom_Chr01g00042051 [Helianthus anomalus]